MLERNIAGRLLLERMCRRNVAGSLVLGRTWGRNVAGVLFLAGMGICVWVRRLFLVQRNRLLMDSGIPRLWSTFSLLVGADRPLLGRWGANLWRRFRRGRLFRAVRRLLGPLLNIPLFLAG